jgi:hypothetical protein
MAISPFSTPEVAAADATAEECSRQLLLAYFPEPFVLETLKKFNVPENEQKAIATSLANKDGEVIKLVEQKAATMNPNPLQDPQARQAAVKLFRETLLEIFSSVLKEHGITDEKQIADMLDHVQQQKAERFAKCMEKQKKMMPKEKPAEPAQEAKISE